MSVYYHLKIQNKSNNNFTTTVSTRAVLLPPPARPPSPRPAPSPCSRRIACQPPMRRRRSCVVSQSSVWTRHPDRVAPSTANSPACAGSTAWSADDEARVHKEGMSDGAYKEMAEAIKRVARTRTSRCSKWRTRQRRLTAVCMTLTMSLNDLLFTQLQQTKIMRIGGHDGEPRSKMGS